ncbi:hypothetical protein [Chryseobacterium sp. EO14]|uniref:hypothetical protein n=1 Tax=Chryseobacterium sp. EO14 TaxID=2950551 RepID=UPI00210A4A2A|nr:hypothetical protein [Chryseobacterium sp. EO14]MCQ4139193.1 hypothetical protein [Chryseobacterium sp. EO14]
MNNGNWKIGKNGYCIITNTVNNTISEGYHIHDAASELRFYGGYLIAESIHPANQKVIEKSKEMFELLDSLENDDKSIPESIWSKIQEVKNYIKY